MLNQPTTNTFDCGDGVPDLVLQPNDPITQEIVTTNPTTEQPTKVGAPLAVMALTVVGQLVILLAVLVGGNALVGAGAGLALLVCALTVLGARTLRLALFGQ